ncbi:unnamed protein product [Closterium sp. Yama58-4]|nr:unnamed protein product [Closterium sp. Yama58-4]
MPEVFMHRHTTLGNLEFPFTLLAGSRFTLPARFPFTQPARRVNSHGSRGLADRTPILLNLQMDQWKKLDLEVVKAWLEEHGLHADGGHSRGARHHSHHAGRDPARLRLRGQEGSDEAADSNPREEGRLKQTVVAAEDRRRMVAEVKVAALKRVVERLQILAQPSQMLDIGAHLHLHCTACHSDILESRGRPLHIRQRISFY